VLPVRRLQDAGGHPYHPQTDGLVEPDPQRDDLQSGKEGWQGLGPFVTLLALCIGTQGIERVFPPLNCYMVGMYRAL